MGGRAKVLIGTGFFLLAMEFLFSSRSGKDALIGRYKQIQNWTGRHRYLAVLVLSLVLSVLLRVPYYQHDFTFVDEAWWANGANVLCRGGQLYVDVALDKNPPIFWLCAFLFRIFGISMGSIHAGALLLVCLTSVLLFILGTRFFSPAVGAAAASIHAVASTTYYIPRIVGMNTETLMAVFSTAAAGSALSGLLRKRGYGLFVAGLFASFAFLTKPVAITELAFLAAFVVAAGGDRLILRLRSAVILLSGFALGVGGFLAWMWHAHILRPWWNQAILYGFRYVSRISAGALLVRSLRANAGFGLIFAWLLILVWMGRRMRRENSRAYSFVAFWALSAFMGVVIGRRYYANYFIQVIPPLSLLGAIGLVCVWKIRHQAGVRLLRRICVAAFLSSFLWFHSRTLTYWASLAYPQIQELQLWNMGVENRINREISEHLIRGSSAQDRIFIWGSKPQLYFLTGRPMATPWMDFDVADDFPPQAAEPWVQARMAEELRKVLPRYIVDVQQMVRIEDYPDFRSLMEKHYSIESKVAGVRIFRLRQEPVRESREVAPPRIWARGAGTRPLQFIDKPSAHDVIRR